jgi:hypothetical protein
MYSGSPCTSFVELGMTRGYLGEHAYRFYYAVWDQRYGVIKMYPSDYTSPDGVNHTYWVRYDGAQQFSLLRDGIVISVFGAGQGQGFGGCFAEAGLEVSAVTSPPDYRFHSDTFDLTNLKYGNASGWVGMAVERFMDRLAVRPCAESPNCLNGIYATPGYWQDNK